MLVLGLKAKFCGLGLAIGWLWDCGLRGLALAKNSRPKSWRTTMFTMNFHRLEWIIFQDPRSLLTYRGHPWPFVTVQYQLHSQPGWPWDCGHDSAWPCPWSVGLGLECSGLVNITGSIIPAQNFHTKSKLLGDAKQTGCLLFIFFFKIMQLVTELSVHRRVRPWCLDGETAMGRVGCRCSGVWFLLRTVHMYTCCQHIEHSEL